MKNISPTHFRPALWILPALLAIFIIRPAAAQEKQGGEKTIKIKIVKDVDGEKTIIDTVFATDQNLDSKELQVIMKGIQKKMKEGNEELDAANKELKKIQYEMTLSMADSMLKDSIGKYTMKIFTLDDDEDDDGEGGQFYNYRFKAPCNEFSEYFDNSNQFHWQGRHGNQMYLNMKESDEATLSDLLGDIPMERVKSYTVKERKGGKRIVIDLEDAPLVEKQDRVIYINRAPGKHGSKVIIKKTPGDVKLIPSGESVDVEVETVVKPEKPE